MRRFDKTFLVMVVIGCGSGCSDEPSSVGFDAGPVADASQAATDAASSTDAALLTDTGFDDAEAPDTGDDAGAVEAGADAGSPDVSMTVGPCPLPPPVNDPYTVGVSVFGANNYIEYIPGDLPIIIGAPHGGLIEPDNMPPDDSLSRDAGSRETALLVYERLRTLTGRTPHMVINHVRRNRLNLNRSEASPNETVPEAVQAWTEFHQFVDAASDWVTASCGRGHYFDFHTSGHDNRSIEVGTGLTVARLERDDMGLSTEADRSYYRALAGRSGVAFVEVIRGPTSIGGLLEAQGIRAIPTPMNPDPGGQAFFIGGYNASRHGSREAGVIDGTHLEMHFSYINAGANARRDFSVTLTDALITFMETHYGFDLDAP